MSKYSFKIQSRNQKFVGDITYLWTDEGWLGKANNAAQRVQQFQMPGKLE